jgi:hypothetical protein
MQNTLLAIIAAGVVCLCVLQYQENQRRERVVALAERIEQDRRERIQEGSCQVLEALSTTGAERMQREQELLQNLIGPEYRP